MNRRVLTVIVLFFVLAALGVGGYLVLLAPKEGVLSDRENRMLAERPAVSAQTLLDGSYASNLETYLLDRFPLRDVCIDAANVLKKAGSFATWEDYARVMGVVADSQLIENAQTVKMDLPMVTPRPTRTPTPVPTVTPTPEPTATPRAGEPTLNPTPTPEPTIAPEPTRTPRPTKEPASWEDYPTLFRSYTVAEGERMVNTTYSLFNVYLPCLLYDAYASLLPEDGTLMITYLPDSRRITSMLSYKDPGGIISEYEPAVHALTADNVAAISGTEILSEYAVAGEYVVYRSDHHWTARGAYLVLQRMLAFAGKSLPPYESYEVEKEYPFLGLIYRDEPTAQLKNNPDTFEIVHPQYPARAWLYTAMDEREEMPLLDYSAPDLYRYYVYLGGPSGPFKVAERTDIEPQSTCFLLCDSFGLCTVPMLLSVYDRVVVYDPRYYEPEVGAVSDLIDLFAPDDMFIIISEREVFETDFIGVCNEQF